VSLGGSPRLWLPGPREFTDVQELLPWVDVLVTDYSSIYLDFLLLNRPVIFFTPDLAAYEAECGFSYVYNAMTPGPKVFGFDDFLPALERALTGGDGYEAERGRVKRMFHAHTDGKNTERVLAAIETLLHDSCIESAPSECIGATASTTTQ
jgi:CDP-glycerol glycerophosphotransferase (TagB/SpsB family)